MGASNAQAAFALYASKVTAKPLLVLVYMALVSKDADAEPWWSQGHEILAENAMGRDPLQLTGDEKADALAIEAMRRAVERTITPLFDVGAITVARHSSGRPGNPIHVRYRLWLVHPAPDEKRRVENRSAPDEKCRARTPSTRRKTSEHPTKNVRTPDEKRRAKEYEEYEERDKEQEYMVLSTQPASVRACEAADESGVSGQLAPNEPGTPRAATPWRSPQETAAEQVAEARARREQAEALAS